MRRERLVRAVGLAGALWLVGCGGGGGGGDPLPAPQPPSTDANLAALAVSGGGVLAPAFSPAVTSYTVGSPFAPSTVTVTPTTAHAAADVTVNGVAVVSGSPSTPLPLLLGPTPVTVEVTAEDAVTVKTYTILFLRNGTSGQEAYAKASNTETLDQFGHSIAISGDTMVVGAPFEDSAATTIDGNGADNSAANAGAAYVFVRTGATWTPQAYLKAPNTDIGDQFGYSVAISGDTIAVGANGEDSGSPVDPNDDSAPEAGAVYVFTRTGVTWSLQAYLKASNLDSLDELGFSVALDGDTLVAGARFEASNGNGPGDDTMPRAGAAYVFVRSGVVWTEQQYLKASNPTGDDTYGCSVAISGDRIVVGAEGEDTAAGGPGAIPDELGIDPGAAYVLERTGTVWNQMAYLKAPNPGNSDGFGHSVAVSGGTIVVGAPFEDGSATGVGGVEDEGASDAGAAYVFVGAGAFWTQQAYVKASNTQFTNQFGIAVALSGDALAVGANGEDGLSAGINGVEANVSDSMFGNGAVYYFRRVVATWTQHAYVKASNPGVGDELGVSVALDGATLVTGARLEASAATGVGGIELDDTAPGAGAAYVFR